MTLVKFKNGNETGNKPANYRPSDSYRMNFPTFFSDTLERLWSDETINWMPSVNVRERAEDFVIDLAVPGMNKKDFTVEVDNGSLVVSGERREENKEQNEIVTRQEFHYGSFRRTFNLPESANPESVKATYNDGILTLTIGKKEESKQKPKRQISIE